MPGSFCVVCRARIPKGSRCSRHRTVSPSSRRWHEPGAARQRERALRRVGRTCERCGSTGDLEVHHIVAAADGGGNSLENLTVLCTDCHQAVEKEKHETDTQREDHWTG